MCSRKGLDTEQKVGVATDECLLRSQTATIKILFKSDKDSHPLQRNGIYSDLSGSVGLNCLGSAAN